MAQHSEGVARSLVEGVAALVEGVACSLVEHACLVGMAPGQSDSVASLVPEHCRIQKVFPRC